MARKTTGTTTRSKKTKVSEETPQQTSPEQAVAEVRNKVTPINAVVAAKKPATVDIDEEIRRRAYELFLERKGAPGDQAQDWLVAEREVRSRYSGQNSAALAATQGRS